MPAVSQPQQMDRMDTQHSHSMSSHSTASHLASGAHRKGSSLPSRERVSAAIALVRAKQAAVADPFSLTKVKGIDELKQLKKTNKPSEGVVPNPMHPTISMTSTLTSTSSMRKPFHIMGAPGALKTSASASSHPGPPTPSRQPLCPVDRTEQRKETSSPSDETGKMSFIQNVFASRSEVKGVASSSTLPSSPSMPDEDEESQPRENIPSVAHSAASKEATAKPMASGEAIDNSSVSSVETDSQIGAVDPKMMKDIGQFLDKLHVKDAPVPPTSHLTTVPPIASAVSEEDAVEALRQLSSEFQSVDSSDSEDSEISAVDGLNQEKLAELAAFIDAVANPGATPVPQATQAKLPDVEIAQKKVASILDALDKPVVKTDAPTLAEPVVSSPVYEKKIDDHGSSSSTDDVEYDNTAEQLRTTKPSPIYEQVESLARGANKDNKDPPAMNPDQFASNRKDPPAPTDLSEAVIRLREADAAVAPSYSAESLEAEPIIDAVTEDKLANDPTSAENPAIDPITEEKKESGFDSDEEQAIFEAAALKEHSLDFFEEDFDDADYTPSIGKSLSPVFEAPSKEGDDQSAASGGPDVNEDEGNATGDRIEKERSLYDSSEDEIEIEGQLSGSDDESSEEDLLSDQDMVDYEELLLEALGTAPSGVMSPKQSLEESEPEKLDTKTNAVKNSTVNNNGSADNAEETNGIAVSATESTDDSDEGPDAQRAVSEETSQTSKTSSAVDMETDSHSEMERYECLEQDDESNMGKFSAGASDIDSRQLSDIDENEDVDEGDRLEALKESTSSDGSSVEEMDAQEEATSQHSSPVSEEKKKKGIDDASEAESDNDETVSEMGTRIKMGDLPHSPSMKGAADTDNDSVPWELRDIASEETMKAAGRTRPRAVFTGQRRARVIKSLLSDDSSAVHSQVFPIESNDQPEGADDFVQPEAKLGLSDVVVLDEGDEFEVLETSTYLAPVEDENEDESSKDAASENGSDSDQDIESGNEEEHTKDPEAEGEFAVPAPSNIASDSDDDSAQPARGEETKKDADTESQRLLSADPSGNLGCTLEKGDPSEKPDPDASVVMAQQDTLGGAPNQEAAEDGALNEDDDQDLVQAFLQSGSVDEGDVDLTQEALDSVLKVASKAVGSSFAGHHHPASTLRVNTSTSAGDMLAAPDVLSPSSIARYFVSLDDGKFSAERAQKIRQFQKLIAPVISGEKPSIIETAQIRQAAQKARISLETVDRFLDFADDEQPAIPANVSSEDRDFIISKWDYEMEDLNEDDAISSFLLRHGVSKAGASEPVDEPVDEPAEEQVEEKDLFLPSGIVRYFASLDSKNCSGGQAKKIRHFQKLIAPVTSGEKPSIMEAAQIRQAAKKAKIRLDVVDRFLEFAEYANDAHLPGTHSDIMSDDEDSVVPNWIHDMEDLNEDAAIGAFLSRHEASEASKARGEMPTEEPTAEEPMEEIIDEAMDELIAEPSAEEEPSEDLDLFSPAAIARYFVSLDDGSCSEGRSKKIRYFQKVVAPVISGTKPSIIEAAQIRQAAKKARIPLEVVDRFLEFADNEQPLMPANVSPGEEDQAAGAWENGMEDLNEDDAIGAFLARFGALKAGGHIIMGNDSDETHNNSNNNECNEEEVEVDVEVGYVNKNLHGDDEEEWWKGMSHLEKKAAARREAMRSPDSGMDESDAVVEDEEDEEDEEEADSYDNLSSKSEIDSQPDEEKERPSIERKTKNFFPDDVDEIDMASASFAYDTRTETAIWNRKKAIATHGGWEKHSSWLSPRASGMRVRDPLPIDGVAAAEGLGKFVFSKRLLLAVRRPWRLPYKERTKSHPGFFNVDVHSVYDSSAVHLVSGDVVVTPWEHREVQQRFLHEQSVTFSRNWFGEMPRVRGNPKYKPPFCKPKSMEMPIENIPDPGEWTEEWYTVWKSPYERRGRRVSGSDDDTDSASDDEGSYTDRESTTDRGSFDVSQEQQKSTTSRDDESDYSGSSDENESDDDASWEEAPECGILINVKQKIGERVSRVHPDYTSSLRRSRWRKKYFPRGSFPYK